MTWPTSAKDLFAEQLRLAGLCLPALRIGDRPPKFGGCFVCFPKGQCGRNDKGEQAWAGAVCLQSNGRIEQVSCCGVTQACYKPGLLALREGAILETVVRALRDSPDVLLVNATGRDHPRRAGLALHLGAVLAIPTVGVTDRPLKAKGEWPALVRGACAPVMLDREVIGHWLCTKTNARPVVVHAAWRTDPDSARELVLSCTYGNARTPEPLRRARQVARRLRAQTYW